MTVNDTMSTLNELTETGLARMTALGELNMKVGERMASRQMDLMGRCMEQSAKLMRAATEARGYGDLYKAQADLARDVSEQMMAESKANLQIATEARDQYRAWYEDTLSEVRKHSGLAAASASA